MSTIHRRDIPEPQPIPEGTVRILFYTRTRHFDRQPTHPSGTKGLYLDDIVETHLEYTKSGTLTAGSRRVVERLFKAVLDGEQPLIFQIPEGR